MGLSHHLLFLAALTDSTRGVLRLSLVPVLLLVGVGAFIVTRHREPAGEGGERGLLLSRKSALLAFLVLAVLAGITAVLWVVRGAPDLGWTRYPYVDRRWIVAAYWSGVAGITLVPLVCAAVLRREPLPAPADGPSAAPSRPFRVLLRAGLGVALATLMFGPPWNTAASFERLDPHEQIHLSGLQAIDRGFTPYLGAASVNYGPGLQIATYGYMRLADRFTVPGFREWYGVSLWVGLCIAFAVLFSVLAIGPALVACFLTLLISPVQGWSWSADGALSGPWGWGNLLRALGPILLAMLLYSTARIPRSRGSLCARGAAVGAIWALFAYLSQENLSGGLVTVALIAAAARWTGTIDARGFRAFLLGLGAGFGVACLPLVLYYIAHGGLGEFWRNYALVPARFLRGYGNYGYRGPLASNDMAVAYYALPYLVLVLAGLQLYRFRPFRLAAPLDRNRMLIFSACVALLASLHQALLRADRLHFLATLFALPLVVTVALFHLPAVLARSSDRRWIVRITVLLVTIDLFLPTFQQSRLLELARGRARSFTAEAPAFEREPDVVARRLGPVLEPAHRQQADLMRELRALVGDRPTCVLVDPSRPEFAYAGFVYFVADLEPGPIWLERTDLVADDAMLASFRAHLREHIEHFDAIVSFAPDCEEIELFKASSPAITTAILGAPKAPLYLYYRTSP